jgi:copper chaperone CopZ
MPSVSWIQFEVEGMTCGGCERSVARALGRVPTATDAGASAGAKHAWARLDPAKAEEARAAIQRAGFTAGPWRIVDQPPGR